MRTASPVLALLAAVLALGASGVGCSPLRDDDLFGMSLEVESAQPFATRSDLRARLHDVIEEGCAHIGLDPTRLYGIRLRLVDGGIACGGLRDARGCFRRDEIVLSTLPPLSTDPPVGCIEDTPLPHELLHALIEDPEHADPRWEDGAFWEPLRERLRRPDCCAGCVAHPW